MDRLEATRYAGNVNHNAIEAGFLVARPGVTLLAVDQAVENYILEFKCIPIFKGYKNYPSTCCLSLNDGMVHGIPSNYVLKAGDLLTIDVGNSYDGWCMDSARTRVVGTGFFPLQERLIQATRAILDAELAVIKQGCSLLEISMAAETKALELKANICVAWGGHKIGRALHEEPFIPNGIDRSLSKIKQWSLEKEYERYRLKTGDVICLEPVVTFGSIDHITDHDGWTIRSKDGSLVAHEEDCVLVLDNGHEILS